MKPAQRLQRLVSRGVQLFPHYSNDHSYASLAFLRHEKESKGVAGASRSSPRALIQYLQSIADLSAPENLVLLRDLKAAVLSYPFIVYSCHTLHAVFTLFSSMMTASERYCVTRALLEKNILSDVLIPAEARLSFLCATLKDFGAAPSRDASIHRLLRPCDLENFFAEVEREFPPVEGRNGLLILSSLAALPVLLNGLGLLTDCISLLYKGIMKQQQFYAQGDKSKHSTLSEIMYFYRQLTDCLVITGCTEHYKSLLSAGLSALEYHGNAAEGSLASMAACTNFLANYVLLIDTYYTQQERFAASCSALLMQLPGLELSAQPSGMTCCTGALVIAILRDSMILVKRFNIIRQVPTLDALLAVVLVVPQRPANTHQSPLASLAPCQMHNALLAIHPDSFVALLQSWEIYLRLGEDAPLSYYKRLKQVCRHVIPTLGARPLLAVAPDLLRLGLLPQELKATVILSILSYRSNITSEYSSILLQLLSRLSPANASFSADELEGINKFLSPLPAAVLLLSLHAKIEALGHGGDVYDWPVLMPWARALTARFRAEERPDPGLARGCSEALLALSRCSFSTTAVRPDDVTKMIHEMVRCALQHPPRGPHSEVFIEHRIRLLYSLTKVHYYHDYLAEILNDCYNCHQLHCLVLPAEVHMQWVALLHLAHLGIPVELTSYFCYDEEQILAVARSDISLAMTFFCGLLEQGCDAPLTVSLLTCLDDVLEQWLEGAAVDCAIYDGCRLAVAAWFAPPWMRKLLAPMLRRIHDVCAERPACCELEAAFIAATVLMLADEGDQQAERDVWTAKLGAMLLSDPAFSSFSISDFQSPHLLAGTSCPRATMLLLVVSALRSKEVRLTDDVKERATVIWSRLTKMNYGPFPGSGRLAIGCLRHLLLHAFLMHRAGGLCFGFEGLISTITAAFLPLDGSLRYDVPPGIIIIAAMMAQTALGHSKHIPSVNSFVTTAFFVSGFDLLPAHLLLSAMIFFKSQGVSVALSLNQTNALLQALWMAIAPKLARLSAEDIIIAAEAAPPSTKGLMPALVPFIPFATAPQLLRIAKLGHARGPAPTFWLALRAATEDALSQSPGFSDANELMDRIEKALQHH